MADRDNEHKGVTEATREAARESAEEARASAREVGRESREAGRELMGTVYSGAEALREGSHRYASTVLDIWVQAIDTAYRLAEQNDRWLAQQLEQSRIAREESRKIVYELITQARQNLGQVQRLSEESMPGGRDRRER